MSKPAYLTRLSIHQVNFWFGRNYRNTTPTWQFIYNGLLANAAVESLYWGGDNHYLSVTGFHWTDANQDGVIDASDNATIDVVDPGRAE